jgi:hypothetical protein
LEDARSKEVGSDKKDLSKWIAKIPYHGAANEPTEVAHRADSTGYSHDDSAACLEWVREDSADQHRHEKKATFHIE